ncbi:MAG TPA: TonB-dependent receptor [Opitutaceae bacterium]|nr:TonB-dependent receptor [Opitutaceae bacterium]
MKTFPCLLLSFILASAASAQAPAPAASAGAIAPTKLDPFAVSAGRAAYPAPSLVTAPVLPVTASIDAARIDDTVNLVDTEDAVKYLPSVFLRKRNYGDTQAVMATRTWGVSSSARSLVFADGVPLSALIANNNNIGAPRWGLVAPAEIERIDLMYGPFSAAYAGNSIGAVMEITTRLPERAEGSLSQTLAWQDFSLYGTRNTYRTAQAAATAGGRAGALSVWTSANFQDSHSQPLSFVTAGAFPAGTSGGYAAANKLGAPADVLGAGGLLHTGMTNATFKAAYDLTPALRATYTFGFWENDADSTVQTYLRDASGRPTFAGQSGFASGYYHLLQQHSSHSLSLRTHNKGNWDFEAVASLYRMDKDEQRLPTTASATGTGFGSAGRIAVLGGTGWSTLDLKGLWRPSGSEGPHLVTFGAHDDRYKLYNPTFNTSDWQAGAPTTIATEGDGKTRTQALWVQDAWQLTPALKLTTGVRYEEWRADDGYNANGATAVRQPGLGAVRSSPKAILAWTASPQWTFTASIGQAYRFATASELYQLVSTGSTFTSPNPNLKPDDVLAAELRVDRRFEHGRARLALFQDEVHDAMISQFNPLVPGSTALFSYVSNVDHVRSRGAELWLDRDNVFVSGLSFSGSVTYLDARTLATSGQASATAPAGSAIGKRLPNIPDWRAAFAVTYRPSPRWAVTVGGRYSGMMFTTLDDADVNPNTYQGFAAWFVADAHADLRLSQRWSASVGADNLLNRKYFLFHPFPQRTVILGLKCAF